MVFKLHVRPRIRFPSLAVVFVLLVGNVGQLQAESRSEADQAFQDAKRLYRQEQYFSAARYAFSAKNLDSSLQASADALSSQALVRAKLYQSASYFFIRTLESGDREMIRRVLEDVEVLLVQVGIDVIRPALVQHTRIEDYNEKNRSAYFYALGKKQVLQSQWSEAERSLSEIDSRSPWYVVSRQLRGTVYAIQGKNQQAIEDFETCIDRSSSGDIDQKARCTAGKARTLYQQERFEEADRVYDQIPKSSFVWPEILFEQAWNAYARKEYNRALGKLVTYKSPHLNYVFNSEVDILTAQTYLSLCLTSDAKESLQGFQSKYTRLGESIRSFVENNEHELSTFFKLGREAFADKLHTRNELHRFLNRFVRTPYFVSWSRTIDKLEGERQAIDRFDRMTSGAQAKGVGFPGFLSKVINWRRWNTEQLAGAYVKNSMIDYHASLIADFEKASFIQLDLLSRTKQLLQRPKNASGEDTRHRGGATPSRRSDQYFFGFNGEFWADELGDYIFALESNC